MAALRKKIEARILVIDGDAKSRRDIAKYLTKNSFEVIEAENSENGIDLFRNQQPDLVLCEFRFMAPSGIRLVKLLAAEAPERVPIIILSTWTSAWTSISDVLGSMRIGASDYFIKPIFNFDIFIYAIKRNLQRANLIAENQMYREQLEKTNRELKESLVRLEEDQRAGREVQTRMLPPASLKVDNFEFSHFVLPSLLLTGDMVDYVPIGKHNVFFLIADVSGHGASSAFITVLIKNLVLRYRNAFEDDNNSTILHPARFLSIINKELVADKLDKFATCFVGVIDLLSNNLTYAVAGCFPQPIFVSNKTPCYLDDTSIVLGLMEEVEYVDHTLALSSGDHLILSSDGIFELLETTSNMEFDKEELLLDLAGKSWANIKDLIIALKLDRIGYPPDDIAILLLTVS